MEPSALQVLPVLPTLSLSHTDRRPWTQLRATAHRWPISNNTCARYMHALITGIACPWCPSRLSKDHAGTRRANDILISRSEASVWFPSKNWPCQRMRLWFRIIQGLFSHLHFCKSRSSPLPDQIQCHLMPQICLRRLTTRYKNTLLLRSFFRYFLYSGWYSI